MIGLFHDLRRMAAEDIDRFRKEKTRAAILYALAAVLGLTAYGCAVAALVIWAARRGDPVIAVGVAAAAFAALALILLAVVATLNRAERRRRAVRAEIYTETMKTAASSTLLGLLGRPQTLAAGAAIVVAGLALGLLGRKRQRRRPPEAEGPPPPPGRG